MRRPGPALLAAALVVLFARLLQAAPAAARQAPLTFEELTDVQRAHCAALLLDLNAPVDWHLALDLSGSYSASLPTLSETAAGVLRALPLQSGDSLWIDTFGSGYRLGLGPGKLDAAWIHGLRTGSSRSQTAIESWLPSFVNPGFDAHTDLESLPARLGQVPHTACPRGVSYFVVLTDGKNEPPDRKPVTSLFAHAAPGACLAERLVSLIRVSRSEPAASRPLGALFVIDTRFLSRADAARARHEWGQQGQRELHTHLSQAHRGSTLEPEIVVWRQTAGGEDLLGEGNRRSLARQDGLFACLVSSWVPARFDGLWKATERHRPQLATQGLGRCHETSQGCQVAIPSESLFGLATQHRLPLLLLARGNTSETLLVTVGGTTQGSGPPGGPTETQRYELKPRGDEGSGWRIYEPPVELTFDEDTLARRPPPWRVSLAFEEAGRPREFLRLQLQGGLHPDIIGSLEPASREALAALPRRGRGWALLAVLCALLSWLFTHLRTTSLLVEVTLQGLALPSGTFRGVYHQRHLRYSFTERELPGKTSDRPLQRRRIWGRAFRRDGPAVASSDAHVTLDRVMELDVIPLFGMVYHVVYYQDERAPFLSLAGRDRVQPFDTGVRGVLGLFFLPAAFWGRPPIETASPASVPAAPAEHWRQQLRVWGRKVVRWLTPLPLDWTQEIFLPRLSPRSLSPPASERELASAQRPSDRWPVTVTTRLTPEVPPPPAGAWRTWWASVRHALYVAIFTDLAVTCALLSLIGSFSLDVPSDLRSVLKNAGLILGLVLLTRGVAHITLLASSHKRHTFRRRAKFICSVFAIATIMLGIFLPFASSAAAPVRWLIAAVIVGSCVGVALGAHSLVRTRIRAQRPLNNWDLLVEWFMRISPIVF